VQETREWQNHGGAEQQNFRKQVKKRMGTVGGERAMGGGADEGESAKFSLTRIEWPRNENIKKKKKAAGFVEKLQTSTRERAFLRKG